jgi:hypothetical protein
MALTKSITALITDENGMMTKEFLAMKPEDWASEHMQRRYNAAPPSVGDAPGHMARVCYEHLLHEYRSVRKWFGDDGKLSPLLMSRHLAQLSDGPVGDGMGWDFTPNGDVEPRMIQFKGTLISCQRTLELRADTQMKLDSGSLELGGIVKLVRSAYGTRAEVHTWPTQTVGKGDEAYSLSGAEVARRWVAYRTFVFLIRLGASEDWAWDSSRCRECFGPHDASRRSI